MMSLPSSEDGGPLANAGAIARTVAALADPRAYPWPVDDVTVEHTHTSVVFLAGDRVVKLKKPVDFGFLDYSTVDARRHWCFEEVRLNRRLAPDVYLGVTAVHDDGDGFRVLGREPQRDEEPAVLMRRLPATATLRARVAAGPPDDSVLDAIARRMADFHAAARRDAHVAEFGRVQVVAGNAMENFDQTEDHIGITVQRSVWTRCRDATHRSLRELETLLAARAASGVPCETHGDLRLDHVYLLDDGPAATDTPRIEVIDCVEFNERFRMADPVSDIAFLSMELRLCGHRDSADRLEKTWAERAGDHDAWRLFPFYVAYRSLVRAKVRGFLAADRNAPPEARADAVRKAQAHWLLALYTLEPPARRPAIILVCGLPGTGKSTLARAVADQTDAEWVRTDEVRKRLAGLEPTESAKAAVGAGIYTAEWTERTYEACARITEKALLDGRRVVVDATLGDPARREAFAAIGHRLAVPVVTLVCHTPDDVAVARLAQRRGDASDADANVFARMKATWQQPAGRHVRRIDTSASPDLSTTAALDALADWGLY